MKDQLKRLNQDLSYDVSRRFSKIGDSSEKRRGGSRGSAATGGVVNGLAVLRPTLAEKYGRGEK
ncbi:hypothetical protein HAX54_044815, partial [Datura stramonium]|nr:hypothetical protein [Datura stramonium]